MSDITQSAIAEAAELGLVVVLPGANELQLDLDSAEDVALFQQQRSLLTGDYAIVEERATISKGGRTHIHLKLKEKVSLSKAQRIALQACLGSDRKRELLSLTVSRTLLFENPEEASRVGLKSEPIPTALTEQNGSSTTDGPK